MRHVIFSFDVDDDNCSAESAAAMALEALMGGDFAAVVSPKEFSVDGVELERAGEVIENWPEFAREAVK